RLVFKRILYIFNFIVSTNFTINPTLHYPRTHYSIIPAFQHSNWGEGPNLLFKDKDIDIITKIHKTGLSKNVERNRNITKQLGLMSN
ncbi:MAG: hypothetical protein WBG61_10115, partial [Desulfobacterales bacterium]